MHTLDRRRVAIAPIDQQTAALLDDDRVKPLLLPRLGPDETATAVESVDVVHLHLGLPQAQPAVASPALVAAAIVASGTPLVLTVHDLCPDTVAALDHLLPVADLVEASHDFLASEVLARWGRAVAVTDVAAVLDVATLPARPSGRGLRIGVLDGPRVDPVPLERSLRREGDVDWAPSSVHPSEVAPWMARCDVVVLPPLVRGRSTWIEAARQLGVGIVVPVAADEVDPRATATYVRSASAGTMARAVLHALPRLPVARPEQRSEDDRAARLRERHTVLYGVLAAARDEDDAWTR